MKLAIASGKGGTGKTTVATNLAVVASRADRQVVYLDCDVEEPNGGIFLKPVVTATEPVCVSTPAVDAELCDDCGRCSEICQFSAILPMQGHVLVFPELCHGCAGCWLVCPTGAVTESQRQVGRISQGLSDRVTCVTGLLDIGQAVSPPVIAAVKRAAPKAEWVIIDAPPGTSCPAIESVRGSDYVVLVTEPTPFGLHDLKLSVDMVKAMGLPFGVVINRADVGTDETRAYCREDGIELLAEIPDDRRIAQAYSRGDLACEVDPSYLRLFEQLLTRIELITAGTSGATA